MPRRPNTKPTNIYWLIDTRPEIITSGWPIGKPFYCGKTIKPPSERLSDHRYTATKFPSRRVCRALLEIGDSVAVKLVEIVPLGTNWAHRERHWIKTLRHLNPDCVNVSDGGDGPAGYIPTPETREKLRRAQTGRKMPPGHGAKIAAKTRGRKRAAHAVAATAAARRGTRMSQEQKEKIRATLTGYKHPPEFGQKLSARLKGRKMPPEFGQKIAERLKGKPLSLEHRAKLSAAKRGKKRSAESIEKSAAYHRGRPKSAEHRAKISAAQKGRSPSPEHLAAVRAGQKRRREREIALAWLTNSGNVVR